MAQTGKERIVTALQCLSLNFGKELPDMLLRTWLQLLAKNGFTVSQIEAGVERLISTYTFKTLPPFAELKKAIEESSPNYVDEGTLRLAAEAEWAKLREMVPRVGIYRTPTFDDETTAAVVWMTGGWSAQCDMWEKDMPFRKKEFVELWIQARGKEDQIALGAAGVIESGKTLPGSEAKPIGGQYALQ